MRTTGSGQSALLLLDAVALLRAQSIEYAVIGAMAGAVHGFVRASLDADAVLSLAVRDAAKLRDTFAAAGFRTDLRRGDSDDPIPALIELQDSFGNRVDLLVGIRGFQAEAFSRVTVVPFNGEELRIVGREDFIAMKLFAGGPQDLLDAKHAHTIAPSSLDIKLLRTLAKSYGSDTANKLEELLAT